MLMAQLGGGESDSPPLTRLYHDHDYGPYLLSNFAN